MKNSELLSLEKLSLEGVGSNDFFKLNDPVVQDPYGKEDHLRLVTSALAKLKAGDMQKVVLSRQEMVPLKSSDPVSIFIDLLHGYPDAFVYCWYHPSTGIWLGATPETLIKTEGLNFKTMALAGTQKFKGEMNVTWGEKEILEQEYVTTSILDDLKDTELTEDINVSETYTSRAGGVLHLKTDISGKLKCGDGLGAIIRSLHPTPAVCGLPKEKSRNYILEEESFDREFYTGFLGELNFQEKLSRSRTRRNTENLAYSAIRKKTALFVNLRCMKLEEDKAIIFVGGGITKDSNPEDEYLETVNKAQTMKKVLIK